MWAHSKTWILLLLGFNLASRFKKSVSIDFAFLGWVAFGNPTYSARSTMGKPFDEFNGTELGVHRPHQVCPAKVHCILQGWLHEVKADRSCCHQNPGLAFRRPNYTPQKKTLNVKVLEGLIHGMWIYEFIPLGKKKAPKWARLLQKKRLQNGRVFF